ncbi:MAG: hypothetical protein RIR00_669 [Pseudomonadota bacterium]
MTAPLPFAAILAPRNSAIDALLADFAADLQRQGYQVRGLIQQSHCQDAQCLYSLRDLASGELYPISQDLGPLSQSCRLDPAGMASAAAVLRRALDQGADLVIVNRFGGLEAQGEGFAQEIGALLSLGLPVLTVVSPDHQAAWQHYSGGLGSALPALPEAWATWFAGLPARDAGMPSGVPGPADLR